MAGLSLGLRFDESSLSRLPLVRRFSAGLPELRPARIHPAVRAAAREGWENRTRSEYEGMTLVRRFHGLTVELNAPMDLQELALKMALQEQQHARYCMSAAASLGSEGLLTFAADRLAGPPDEGDPRTRFWEMVCGSFAVSETAALRLLAAGIRMLPPSGYRGILETILADESLHARIGFLILASARLPAAKRRPDWIEAPSDAWIRDHVRGFVDAGLRRDVIDPAEAALFEDPAKAAALMSLGIPPSLSFKSAYLDALRKDVPRRFKALGIAL